MLCPSETFPYKNFTVYGNKHNQHSLSITKLTVTHKTHNTHPFYRSTNTHSAMLFAANLNTFIISLIHMPEDRWL